ncbi:Protein of unknown function [Pyronema omphalodes CBS 100304]|uniref:Uncharacterized protein n=1 Tax=Pyronema omphalodes (strain CBS 100304) TaxID=1076935 RepID=U4L7Y2_PYROM|nr:Protein of unknown function [Pyronema omphalodes CBS 100304]
MSRQIANEAYFDDDRSDYDPHENSDVEGDVAVPLGGGHSANPYAVIVQGLRDKRMKISRERDGTVRGEGIAKIGTGTEFQGSFKYRVSETPFHEEHHKLAAMDAAEKQKNMIEDVPDNRPKGKLDDDDTKSMRSGTSARSRRSAAARRVDDDDIMSQRSGASRSSARPHVQEMDDDMMSQRSGASRSSARHRIQEVDDDMMSQRSGMSSGSRRPNTRDDRGMDDDMMSTRSGMSSSSRRPNTNPKRDMREMDDGMRSVRSGMSSGSRRSNADPRRENRGMDHDIISVRSGISSGSRRSDPSRRGMSPDRSGATARQGMYEDYGDDDNGSMKSYRSSGSSRSFRPNAEEARASALDANRAGPKVQYIAGDFAGQLQ